MTTSSSPSDAVLIERQDGVIQLTLNAPRNRNSLQSPGVYEGLMAGLDELERDTRLRAAIITGTGGAFCSGGDLRTLAQGSEDEVRAAMTRNTWLYRRIALSDKLVLAAVDGPAYGAGLGLGDSPVLLRLHSRGRHAGRSPVLVLAGSSGRRSGTAHDAVGKRGRWRRSAGKRPGG